MVDAITNIFAFTWDIFNLLSMASELILEFMGAPIDSNIAEFMNIPIETTNIELMLTVGLTIALVTLVIKMFTSILG